MLITVGTLVQAEPLRLENREYPVNLWSQCAVVIWTNLGNAQWDTSLKNAFPSAVLRRQTILGHASRKMSVFFLHAHKNTPVIPTLRAEDERYGKTSECEHTFAITHKPL